jgi:hypothetical protein
MSDSEFEFEPIRGLPAALPAGERLLWQGAPGWTATAHRVFHIRGVGYYFGAILLWRAASGVYAGQPPHQIAVSMSWLTLLALATLGFLALVSHMIARGTVYTLTSRRIVMRFGMVFPMSVNIPFGIIESAALRTYPDGTGDIPLQLRGDGRIAYPHLWPHARPWAINRPQPMLRGIDGAPAAALLIANALRDSHFTTHATPTPLCQPSPETIAA